MKSRLSSARGKPADNWLSWGCAVGKHDFCFYATWFKVPYGGCVCRCHTRAAR
jgi:hypothetical protein